MDRNKLSVRLALATSAKRAALQQRLDDGRPFESNVRYRRFLLIQYAFYRQLDGLYDHTGLLSLVPSLSDRRRLSAIVADLYDLGMPIPLQVMPPTSKHLASINTASALGQLHVAEGPLLRGAHLLREARLLGFSETMGARHLAVPALGCNFSWQAFMVGLDAWARSEDEVAQAIEGAFAALHVMDIILGGFLPAAQA